MNVLVITGNIGADAEVKEIREDLFAVNFNVAVTKNLRDGEKKTTWFKCIWFLKNPKVAEFLKKSNVVAIRGEAELEKYTGTDGVERTNLKCLVEDVKFCYTKPTSNDQN